MFGNNWMILGILIFIFFHVEHCMSKEDTKESLGFAILFSLSV